MNKIAPLLLKQGAILLRIRTVYSERNAIRRVV